MSAWNLCWTWMGNSSAQKAAAPPGWEFRGKSRGLLCARLSLLGVVNEAALRSSFLIFSVGTWEVYQENSLPVLVASVFPDCCSLSPVVQQLLVRFMARWKQQTLLHVVTGGSKKDLRLWCFCRSCGWIQLLGTICCITYRWKQQQLMSFLVWPFAFLSFFFLSCGQGSV